MCKRNQAIFVIWLTLIAVKIVDNEIATPVGNNKSNVLIVEKENKSVVLKKVVYKPGKYLELIMTPECKMNSKNCICGEHNNFVCSDNEVCTVPKGFDWPRRYEKC